MAASSGVGSAARHEERAPAAPGPRVDAGAVDLVALVNAVCVGAAHAALLSHGWGVQWGAWNVAVAAALYVSVTLSISAGYHRLWTHRAFRADPRVATLLGVCGAAAFQGSVLWWARRHRLHHAAQARQRALACKSRADARVAQTPLIDPMSHAEGFWAAHMGWLYRAGDAQLEAALAHVDDADLRADAWLAVQHRLYPLLAPLVGFGLPILLTGSLREGLGVAAVSRVASLHATLCIHSLAHASWWLGTNTAHSDAMATARDDALTSVLTMGEGYQSMHHAFPFDYRGGAVRFHHWDPTKWLILMLEARGLASGLRTVPDAHCDRLRFEAALANTHWQFAHVATLPRDDNLPAMGSALLAREGRDRHLLALGRAVYHVPPELLAVLPCGERVRALLGCAPEQAEEAFCAHPHSEAALAMLRMQLAARVEAEAPHELVEPASAAEAAAPQPPLDSARSKEADAHAAADGESSGALSRRAMLLLQAARAKRRHDEEGAEERKRRSSEVSSASATPRPAADEQRPTPSPRPSEPEEESAGKAAPPRPGSAGASPTAPSSGRGQEESEAREQRRAKEMEEEKEEDEEQLQQQQEQQLQGQEEAPEEEAPPPQPQQQQQQQQQGVPEESAKEPAEDVAAAAAHAEAVLLEESDEKPREHGEGEGGGHTDSGIELDNEIRVLAETERARRRSALASSSSSSGGGGRDELVTPLSPAAGRVRIRRRNSGSNLSPLSASVFQSPEEERRGDGDGDGGGDAGAGGGAGDEAKSPPPKLFAKAVFDFTAKEPNCLSFKSGTILAVLDRDQSGWWFCEQTLVRRDAQGQVVSKRVEQGFVPRNFLQVLDRKGKATAAKAAQQARRHHGSVDGGALLSSLSMTTVEEEDEEEVAEENGRDDADDGPDADSDGRGRSRERSARVHRTRSLPPENSRFRRVAAALQAAKLRASPGPMDAKRQGVKWTLGFKEDPNS